MERGETLIKAKQSFLNAGYSPEEVQSAVREMSITQQPIRQPLDQTQSQIPGQTKPLQPQQPKSSKKLIIILSIIGVIILIAAAVLGIFWDSLF
ncbi:MAG: hypothetical protein V1888_04415 [archaeon]